MYLRLSFFLFILANKNDMDIVSLTAKNLDVREIDIYVSKTEKCTTARYIIWYYLHYNKRKSIAQIAHQFHYAVRTVCYGISKIRDGILHQKYYKEQYDQFINKIAAKCP